MAAEFLTAQEVADILKVRRAWVYDHKASLGYLDIGGRVRFDRRSLERYIDQHTHPPLCRPGRPRKSQRRIVRRIAYQGGR